MAQLKDLGRAQNIARQLSTAKSALAAIEGGARLEISASSGEAKWAIPIKPGKIEPMLIAALREDIALMVGELDTMGITV